MTGCYILFSEKLNKFYIGVTQNDLEQRILKHNMATYGKNRFTATANDWKIFLFIKTDNYPHAIRIERKIKAMKSTQYIKNLKEFPEMMDKIIRSAGLSR